ncbi:MAG: hypothetical protein AUI45_05270 [Acidobacteria bacterium 13_1_40CM_2_56_11]|nr:MAG: hypothetical protein AUI45_05270 [Acidobacteria bacterium 13_1_40CM_2_56_11]
MRPSGKQATRAGCRDGTRDPRCGGCAEFLEFLLIARTDARAVESLDCALERASLYREAGADVLFVEAPETEQEIEAIAESLRGTPLLFNWAEGGKTPPVSLELRI